MKIARVALALLAFTAPVQADWIYEARGVMSYDDNISRSNREADVRDDAIFRSVLRVGRFDQLTDDLRLTLAADVEGQVLSQFTDFNSFGGMGEASLRHRFGLGALAPFLRVEAGAGYHDFAQSWQDGARFRAGATMGKRLTERFAAELGYRFEAHDAQIRTFERQAHLISLRTACDLTASTQITAKYEYRHGEVVSYGQPPRPDIVAVANALQPVNTFGTPYVAYNLDAATHAVSIGVSHACNRMFALSLAYERQETTAFHLDYSNNVVTASVNASF